MKKSKKRKLIILVSLLLMTTVLGIGGYSYAKYRTVAKGEGTFDVAKWSFKLKDGNSQEIQTMKLEDTTIDMTKLRNGKIAPGTSGNFEIEVDATGTEVGLGYDIVVEKNNNKPTNLKFYCNNTEITSGEGLIHGQILANNSTKKQKYTIEWEWPYSAEDVNLTETYDMADTEDGENILTSTFNVVVTGTQLPTK